MSEASDCLDATETRIDSVPGAMLEPAKLGVQHGWLYRGWGRAVRHAQGGDAAA